MLKVLLWVIGISIIGGSVYIWDQIKPIEAKCVCQLSPGCRPYPTTTGGIGYDVLLGGTESFTFSKWSLRRKKDAIREVVVEREKKGFVCPPELKP